MEAFLSKFKQPSASSSSQSSLSPSSSQKNLEQKTTITPWVEKYRPSKIDQVVYQNEVVSVLKKCLTGADLPNLLFYGPPGTGKTSTIIALAKEMFGELYKSRVLELNASDDRGINVIREKVKNFAQMTVSAKTTGSKIIPPLKIVILDEADSMTSFAQSALRRTMEKESKTTRFCLICNYVSRIIEPIASRCSIFRFKPLETDLVIGKLREISTKEQVNVNDDVLKKLVNISEGDLRRSITLLQSAVSLRGKTTITVDDIDEIAGLVPDNMIQQFIFVCQSQSYEKLSHFTSDFIADGYSAVQLIIQLHDWLVQCDQMLLNDKQKSQISQHLGLTDHRLLDGADEYLQILDIGSVIIQALSTN